MSTAKRKASKHQSAKPAPLFKEEYDKIHYLITSLNQENHFMVVAAQELQLARENLERATKRLSEAEKEMAQARCNCVKAAKELAPLMHRLPA